MAPLPESFPNALLSLLPRSLIPSTPTIKLDSRTPGKSSPMVVHGLQTFQKRTPSVNPMSGAIPPNEFNNKGIQFLFALIGICMVIGSIWFFFWAKNGGCVWRKTDWEDYKTTVLRRKGPNGTTLSGATASTKLGGGSVVHGGSYGNTESVSEGYTDETATSADTTEMQEVEAGHGRGFGLRGGDGRHGHRNESSKVTDPELRDYRHEKAARVGGLNRQHDGNYFDYSNTGSEVSQQPLTASKDKKQDKKERDRRAKEAKRSEKAAQKSAAAEAKAQKEAEKASKAKAKKNKDKTDNTAPTAPHSSEIPNPEAQQAARRAFPSAAYSFTTGDDASTVYTTPYTATHTAPSEAGNTYYSDYRPHAEPAAAAIAFRSHNSTPNRSEREREHRSGSHSRHSSPRKHHSSRPSSNSDIFSSGGTEETGTKIYPCHIPGLSAGSVGVGESVSQVGGSSGGRRGRDVMDGYRRGGVRGRRDSLSDSDS